MAFEDLNAARLERFFQLIHARHTGFELNTTKERVVQHGDLHPSA